MSRAHRVMRGVGGAGIATLLAAASHGIAGGAITWIAVVATALVALPLCTALAGRVGSLWRLSIAVTSAQFLYHWSFAGLGLSQNASTPLPAHAAHMNALNTFMVTANADTTMWTLHALAAAATIALIHRGERAFLGLLRLVQRALPHVAPPLLGVPHPRTAPAAQTHRVSVVARLWSAAVITHRGPPALA